VKVLTGTKALKVAKTGSSILLRVGAVEREGEPWTLEGTSSWWRRAKSQRGGAGAFRGGRRILSTRVPADRRMRTNVPHIYSCGDVNGVFPFTHVAGYEAGIALANAVLRLPRKSDYTKVPWCTYTDPEVASVGLNEKRANAAGVEYRTLEAAFRDVDRALAEGETGGRSRC